MLANIIDIDESMLHTAAEDSGGMAFFFDFVAAFPSIEHLLLMNFFQHLNWPSWLLNFVSCLYHCNYCQLSLAGVRYPGFRITRGVRQGCPISSLLFAACSDLFLRRLCRLIPQAVCRAYADDLALVTPHGRRCLRTLQKFFTEFELISGLGLSIPKTVMVPLDPYDEMEMRAVISEGAPGWGGLTIATAAKYLGVYLGPGHGELSWDAPVKKFLQRAEQWGGLGAGLLLTLKAFTVYVASVLLFVGQLEELPDSFSDIETRACRRLFPGPKDWITADGLRELKSLHFPSELKDIESTIVAAKARVSRFEAAGKLNIQNRAFAMQALTCRSLETSFLRLGWFGNWRNSSLVLNLHRAAVRADTLRQHQVAASHTLGQKNWQKQTASLIYGTPRAGALTHLRRRLDHWRLKVSPGLRVNRALRVLQVISNECQPRVRAATFRLFCNGWCTYSRFGVRGQCRMQCGMGEDSVRHLACCPVVQHLFWFHLGIQAATRGLKLETFLGLGSTDRTTEEVTRRALAIYALYRTFNGLRHNQFVQGELDGAFDGFLREASRGNESID